MIGSSRVKDSCFVELARSICTSREVRQHVGRGVLVRSGAQELFYTLRLQRLSRGGRDLRVVVGCERNENFQQIVLRQRQKTARGRETCRLRSATADYRLDYWISGCDVGGQRGNFSHKEAQKAQKSAKLFKPFVPLCGIEPIRLGVDAVALLILLTRAARAGLVASNFRLVSDDRLDFAVFLARGSRALIWSSETQ